MNNFHNKKILLLGSGGLRIGQAGELDCSGYQAIKALKEEGTKVVLVNPNIASVQTDQEMADATYFYPLNVSTVSRIIEKERPNGILLGFGGKTALNLGIALEDVGILTEYNVQVLGTPLDSIRETEDRVLFNQKLNNLSIKAPKSGCATSVTMALQIAETIKYPVMIRSGFSLGGLGLGKVLNPEELAVRMQEYLAIAPHVVIEEYLHGWKEFEYEIMRDSSGNSFNICNMENMDPMGIHTGESIVVTPAQTLDKKQHQYLKDIALNLAAHFNIIGECNIQFAINPSNGDYKVIKINARLSRSSSLASKATGYPLAFVAAKLALGKALYKIPNNVTKKTYSFFEPALDYIVVKIPRWDTGKFKEAKRYINSEMKSIGAVMAIGKSFPEALQKAVGMLNIGASCLNDYRYVAPDYLMDISRPTDLRLFALYNYFYNGGNTEEAYELSRIDTWFLRYIQEIVNLAKRLEYEVLTTDLLKLAKQFGFSDAGIGKITKLTEQEIRKLRLQARIIPYVKKIDTLIGELAAQTNYLYLTYHACEHDVKPADKKPILIIGAGPYSIGSSIEFDWVAVNTIKILREFGECTIVVNSNPETVSTDYDISDRLYFEQLTLERIEDIADFENPKGIIVSVGGQISNNLALPLTKTKYPILGTSAYSIDIAENRKKLSSLLHSLGIAQPDWSCITSLIEAKDFANKIGYPVLIRPSYILAGAAINVAKNKQDLEEYLNQAFTASVDQHVVISKFIQNALEVEIDGVADTGRVVIEAVYEHIENAGVHSGDATLVLPAKKIAPKTLNEIKIITNKIIQSLEITGPFNIQFLIKNDLPQVIECNLRASRALPFISKVTNCNFAKIIAKVLIGQHTAKTYETFALNHVGVKVPQFSYNSLKGVDPVAGVAMASTGEVACIGRDLLEAFFNAWRSTEQNVIGQSLLLSISDCSDSESLGLHKYLKLLLEKGWEIYTINNTNTYLKNDQIINIEIANTGTLKARDIANLISKYCISLVINTLSSEHLENDEVNYLLRRTAIDNHIPLITNIQNANLLLQSLVDIENGKVSEIKSWHEWVGYT